MSTQPKALKALEEVLLSVSKPECEALVPTWAANISMVASLGRINDLPRARTCNPERAHQEIAKLKKQAQEMRLHIQGMHKTSLETFAPNSGFHPLLLIDGLYSVEIEGEQILQQNKICPSAKNQGPTKGALEPVTRMTAKAYTALSGIEVIRKVDVTTGKAYGQFHELLQKVFKVLGHTSASADSQIRKLNGKKLAEKATLSPLETP